MCVCVFIYIYVVTIDLIQMFQYSHTCIVEKECS